MTTLKLCLVSLVLLTGCPYNPNPAPPTDADASASDANVSLATKRACVNLRMLGCPEGGPKCEETVEHVRLTKITAFDVECVAGAANVDAVRLCPAIKCSK